MRAKDETEADKLLRSEIRVVNIGLREFGCDLEARNIAFIHVDWLRQR